MLFPDLSLGQEDPLEKRMATHSSILALENPSHGQKSLAGYSPLGCKESDTTKQLTHTHIHTSIDIMDPYDLWIHNGMRFDPKKYTSH